MTPLQRYIAEEIATDHLDGLLSRRDAMRRLALLGLGTAGATALIASCGNAKQTPGASSSTTTGSTAATPPGMDHALPPGPVVWAGPNGQLQGAWAESACPRGGVLGIH